MANYIFLDTLKSNVFIKLFFTSADVTKCYTETQPKTPNSKQCRCRSTVARKHSLERQEPRKKLREEPGKRTFEKLCKYSHSTYFPVPQVPPVCQCLCRVPPCGEGAVCVVPRLQSWRAPGARDELVKEQFSLPGWLRTPV